MRHRGTIGGSLANNDPSACYPAAALALGATIVTDRRRIEADDFFQGMFTTALEQGELITAVEFPIPEKSHYMKFRNPASRYAMVGVFVAKGPKGVRVAVTGAGQGGVFRHAAMEAALMANWSPDAVAGIKTPPDDLNSDIHGSAEYRAHLITVMAKRAVAAAGVSGFPRDGAGRRFGVPRAVLARYRLFPSRRCHSGAQGAVAQSQVGLSEGCRDGRILAATSF